MIIEKTVIEGNRYNVELDDCRARGKRGRGMTDVKRERIAKSLLEIFRSVWCDRESDIMPCFNCSVCEFEDGEECILKQFIKNTKYETAYPQGAIKDGDDE